MMRTPSAGINAGAPGFYPVVHVALPRKRATMRIPGGKTSERSLQALRGRAAAFDAEALGHVDSLYRTALRLTRSPADAEDLVQETYLKAFRAADRFEPGTNLRAWLFTILHNTLRNRVRDQVRGGVTVDTDAAERAADASVLDTPGRGPTPESLLIREALAPELQAAIDELPETFRQAVWLRDVEEFSYAEIARMLGVPLGTVMSRISRARRMLFNRLHHLNPANV